MRTPAQTFRDMIDKTLRSSGQAGEETIKGLGGRVQKEAIKTGIAGAVGLSALIAGPYAAYRYTKRKFDEDEHPRPQERRLKKQSASSLVSTGIMDKFIIELITGKKMIVNKDYLSDNHKLVGALIRDGAIVSITGVAPSGKKKVVYPRR